MLRTLWFLIKLAAVAALGVWLVMQPGETHLAWMGYEVAAQTGLVIYAAILFALLFAWIYQGWVAIKRAPQAIVRHLDARSQDQALQAVSYGLSAIAAGDAHAATKHAERARKLIRNDHGLVPLLAGMTARLKGDPLAAEAAFKELLNTKETAFIGVRGLLQLALDRRQPDQALVLARQAHRMHPKQGWILKTLYALELRQRNWPEAQDILNRLTKTKSMTTSRAADDRAAMLLARAIEAAGRGQADQSYFLTREAYGAAPNFLPAALAYIPFLIRRDEKRAAMRIIEKSWKVHPHPDLQEAWVKCAPEGTNTPAKIYGWLERLAAFNQDHDLSHLMMAEAAIAQNLTGEARNHVDAAMGIRKSQKSMRLLATLEDKSGHHHAAELARESAHTAAPDRVWVCRESGRIYAAWMPFAPPHNSFNTIVWEDPTALRREAPALSATPDTGDALQLIEYRAA